MPYAVELYFDAAIDATVRELWRRCAQAGITGYLDASANRPHLTLAAYAHLDVDRAAPKLLRFATSHQPLPLTLSHVGGFVQPAPVAFLAPIVTVDLLHLHRSVHEVLKDIGTGPQPAYLPGSWVPHCTIAFHMDDAALTRAVGLCQTIPLPLEGAVREIGLAEVSPTKLLFSAELSGGEAELGD